MAAALAAYTPSPSHAIGNVTLTDATITATPNEGVSSLGKRIRDEDLTEETYLSSAQAVNDNGFGEPAPKRTKIEPESGPELLPAGFTPNIDMDSIIKDALSGLDSYLLQHNLPKSIEDSGEPIEQTEAHMGFQQLDEPEQLEDLRTNNQSLSRTDERDTERILQSLFSDVDAHLRLINLRALGAFVSVWVM